MSRLLTDLSVIESSLDSGHVHGLGHCKYSWWLCLLTDITVHGAVEILDIVPWPTCPEDLCRIQQARGTVVVWRLCETVRLQVDLARTGTTSCMHVLLTLMPAAGTKAGARQLKPSAD